MLDMGFIPDVERIVGLLPKIRQTLFFSATMPPEIRRLADAFLMNPKEIAVAPPASPAATVVQGLTVVEPDDKRETLRRLIRSEDVKNAIIFCNRKRDVDILYRSLKKHGLDVAALHGDMPQSKRTETLERFRNGEVRLLVASDVAARGLDIQGMSHVFNFDVPIHAEDYVHRIGRTGRAGREGRAFTLAAPEDGRFVQAIEQLIGKPIPPVLVDGIAAATLSFEDGDGRSRGHSRRGRGKPHGSAPQHGKPRHEPPRPAKPHEPASKPEAARKPEPARFAPVTMGGTPPAEPARPALAPAANRDRRNADDGPRVVGFGDHMPAFLARRAARG